MGSISGFKPDAESVMAYLKRMKLLLLANEVPNKKHVAIFLSLLGGTTYGILRSLCAPEKPQDDVTYKQPTDLLFRHYEPEPLVIAERFHFYRHDQVPGESVAEYVVELH